MSIALTIDGKTVHAEPGLSVLEAARAGQIYIPTLCYHPKLRPVGACRLCVVEIEGLRGYPTACTVPAAEGMVVHTDTEAVRNLRRETLGLILSEHPYTCLVCRAGCDLYQMTVRKAGVTTGCQYCPSNGQCELQELVDHLDLQEMCYPIDYRGLPVEHEDPFFDRDYNLCILCGRCVRVCQEVRHVGVLAFVNRGGHTIVGTAFGRSHLETDCQFCGACVDVCPTGALFDKRGKWEGVPDGAVASVCPFCAVGCAVDLQVKAGKVVRAVARDGPANDGQLCVRGRFGVADVVHHLERLRVPLVRRNGRLVEVPWADAETAACEALARVPADQTAVLVSTAATNEEAYLLQRFARTVLGTNHVALAGGLPEPGTPATSTPGAGNGGVASAASAGEAIPGALAAAGRAMPDAFVGVEGPAVREVRDAACIVVVGSNVLQSHPVLGLEIRHARERGACVVCIDPRRTPTSRAADVHLRPRAGSDHVLLGGLATAMGLAGETGPRAAGESAATASRVAEVATRVGKPGDLATVASTTGVPAEAISAAGARMAGRTPAVLIYGSGVTHQANAADILRALSSLAALWDGARLLGAAGEGNIVGAHDMGVDPARLPGYADVGDAPARRRCGDAWGAGIPDAPGRGYEGILDSVREGRIKALVVAGAVPDLPGLGELECLVVLDVVSTPVVEHAHVVLPLATFAEVDGTMTNLEGRVQRLRQAVPPPGVARPGWAVMQDLARRMAEVDAARTVGRWDFASAADVMAEIGRLVPAYAGAGHDALGGAGVRRRFATDGAAPAVAPFALDHVPDPTSPEFPLALVTERNLLHYYGVCLTEAVAGMNLIRPEEVLHVSPADAARLGVASGALVAAVSAHGSTECLVEVDRGMPEGLVFGSFNRLVACELFAHLAPAAKTCAIRIESVKP